MPNNKPPADAASASAMRKKGLTYLLLTAVLILTSVLSIWFINSIFGEGNFSLSFSFITPGAAVGTAGFLFVYFLFDSLRFYCVIRTLGLRVRFLYVAKLTFINAFVSAITPFATGGGFVQLYFLTRRGVPLGSATAASTIRTLLGVAFFLIACPVVLILNPDVLKLVGGGYTWILVITVAVFAVIFVFLLWIFTNERSLKLAVYRFLRMLRRKNMLSPQKTRRACLRVFAEIRNFNAGVRLFFMGSKKFLFLSVLTTVLFLFALFSLPLLLTRFMGYHIAPSFVYQAMILISFITYFAMTPGASGIAEGGFALMFSGSVSEADIASLTLLWRSLAVYVGTAVGLVLFYTEVFTKRKKTGQSVPVEQSEDM